MKRKYLKIEKKIINDLKNGKISIITQNLNKIKKDGIFVCIKGKNVDSHLFINEAFKKGAKYVIGSENFNQKNYFQVTNSRKALAYLLNIYYKFPDTKLKIVGIVGTNGKTSTSYIFKDYCELLGLKCGVIGTNGIFINNIYFENALTTPDSEELFYYLDLMVKQNVEFVFIEVSAHAIKLDKAFSLKFEQLVFTNFSQDHLDFFKTMEDYQNTKTSIFFDYSYKKAIINTDDKVGEFLYNNIKNQKLSYGKSGEICLKKFVLNYDFTKLEVFTSLNKNIIISLLCKYNIYNFLAVFSSLMSLNISEDLLIENAIKLKRVKGRFEVINFSKTHTIIIDYAHTPKSTLETLKAVKEYYPKDYLVTLFGCPGNREQQKREYTGRIISKYSDFCIITSDNPNTENVVKILHQIKKGTKCPHRVIEDRKKALKKSVEIFLQKKSAVLLLLGKGIEDYQIVNTIKIPYNEEKELKILLENN
ncbi:MAG: UDP-N-acetylmuramoyl-L-alanyl-D-glutamate--2,6-diaminopimelate ligase [Clostridia bacterium]|nr:UDP-N-acetylmuramoyl-L-alanyl-D-glutamate--2,6-diaminopimelate ligase [Clostridia bacterium]